MPYSPILATLGYVFSPDGRRVLLVHRTARPNNPHLGKYNGLGGKLHPDEDVVAGLRRELREEAAIECTALHLAGTVSWPGFGTGGEDWFGFVFRVTAFAGTPPAANPEGTLHWVEVGEVLSLPLWDGDRHFLPLVFDPARPQFHGVMPYRDGRPLSWGVSVLPRPGAGGGREPPPVPLFRRVGPGGSEDRRPTTRNPVGRRFSEPPGPTRRMVPHNPFLCYSSVGPVPLARTPTPVRPSARGGWR